MNSLSQVIELETGEEQYRKSAMFWATLVHVLILFITINVRKKEEEKKPEDLLNKPILKVSLVNKTIVPLNTFKRAELKPNASEVTKSPVQVQEEIKKPIKNLEAGTQKVVKDSKALGNPLAKTEKQVQKGDPMSKIFKKYDPSTDLRKLDAANIGTGAKKMDSAKVSSTGGGKGKDSYKGFNFKSDIDGLLNKGNRVATKNFGRGGKGAGAGSGSGIGDGIGDGIQSGSGDGTYTGSTQGTLDMSKIATNVGSLTGSTVGAIDSSKGAEGLSHKGQILIAGEPSDTLVLGSIDPDIIRKLLLEHIPQFRYCYQKELDRNADESLQGIVKLNFIIGPSGKISKADVLSENALKAQVSNCVKGVLLGINFPSPKGGGEVEVNQPINFYARKT